MLNMLFKNPQIMQMLQVLSNSSNPIAQMDIMFGQNPKYQQFKKQFEGKSEKEIISYYSNMLGEQGINLNNLVNMARQFGLIK